MEEERVKKMELDHINQGGFFTCTFCAYYGKKTHFKTLADGLDHYKNKAHDWGGLDWVK